MSAQFISGRQIAERIKGRIHQTIQNLPFTPGLGIILIGEDPASHTYVALKIAASKKVGIAIHVERLPESVTQAEVIHAIDRMNTNDEIDGIVVQLPLPAHLNEDIIVDSIDPKKDVDGFHPDTVACMLAGHPTIIPGLAKGIRLLIEEPGIPIRGNHAVIIANSPVFFPPVEHVLHEMGVSATYIQSASPILSEQTKQADIIIVAVGKRDFLKGSHIKPGAIVIDIGTNRTEDGKPIGDADATVQHIAGYVSPVPGGIGPLTVALLLENTVLLAKQRR